MKGAGRETTAANSPPSPKAQRHRLSIKSSPFLSVRVGCARIYVLLDSFGWHVFGALQTGKRCWASKKGGKPMWTA